MIFANQMIKKIPNKLNLETGSQLKHCQMLARQNISAIMIGMMNLLSVGGGKCSMVSYIRLD